MVAANWRSAARATIVSPMEEGVALLRMSLDKHGGQFTVSDVSMVQFTVAGDVVYMACMDLEGHAQKITGWL